jgi:hypothetical protein
MALSGCFFLIKNSIQSRKKEMVGSLSKLKRQDKAGTLGIGFKMSNSMVG